jgi:iron complex transport system permease protein
MMASTFLFGLAALMLVYLIAALQGRESTLVLILSGIILSGFCRPGQPDAVPGR